VLNIDTSDKVIEAMLSQTVNGNEPNTNGNDVFHVCCTIKQYLVCNDAKKGCFSSVIPRIMLMVKTFKLLQVPDATLPRIATLKCKYHKQSAMSPTWIRIKRKKTLVCNAAKANASTDPCNNIKGTHEEDTDLKLVKSW
jgi:hypothetical protein